jgi:uncharacterized membrane protein
MATLTVWKLDSATGADDGLALIKRLQAEQLLQLQDAAVVSWPADQRKPMIKQLNNVVGVGALGGAFWGLLFGLLFFVPLLGLAIGAGVGALVASGTDVGIDDNLIKQIREKITPGTSALFLMTTSAVSDRVADEMQAFAGHADLIESNLSREQEGKLRATFAQAAAPASAEVDGQTQAAA